MFPIDKPRVASRNELELQETWNSHLDKTLWLCFFSPHALIDSWDHFDPNINRVYMASMMVAPMLILMLWVMGSMYEKRKLNTILYVGFSPIRRQLPPGAYTDPVGNDQFLRSMIPHHSSAIVMCEESAITDPQIIDLCGEIVEAQVREIDEMKQVLAGS